MSYNRPTRGIRSCLLLMGLLISCTLSAALCAQQRIISLAPHITELLFAVGAGDEVVGVVEYSDFPEAARAIPRIGDSERINFEEILSLQPSLILAWQGGNRQESIQRLQELGLKVVSLHTAELEGVASSLEQVGQMTGHKAEGKAAAQLFMNRLLALRQTYRGLPGLRVFYQLSNEPQMTLNGEHLVSDVIRLCGGENIFADAIPLVPRISMESVLRRDPEVIIAPGINGEPPAWLTDWYQWPAIEAVQKGQIFAIDPDLMHRHSPRILDGAERLCQILDSSRKQ